MLSWQQAALLAIGFGGTGMLLVYTSHAARRVGRSGRTGRASRWAGRAGPFLREAGLVVALYALWQLAGSLSAGGFSGAVDHACWIWHTERAVGLTSGPTCPRSMSPGAVLVVWAVITKGAAGWRWLILLYPAATVFVVVATGNHFWPTASSRPR